MKAPSVLRENARAPVQGAETGGFVGLRDHWNADFRLTSARRL